MTNERSGGNGFWIGFFLGGLVGAFIVFLMGTKEGKKVAEKFIENAELYEEELEEKIAKIQKRGEELVRDVQIVKDEVNRHFFKKNGKPLAS